MNDRAPLGLAYSPCPNDTYIFAALTNGLLDDAPQVHAVLEDVESLNVAASRAMHELTKVSYAMVPQLTDQYHILRAGGALGYGCGPLVITRPGRAKKLEELAGGLLAIPGERTTAFLLLQLAMEQRPQTISMRFDKIVDAVIDGTVDAGLIIHETRFTYHDRGLESVCDLGEWWEEATGLPIPLGAILARKDLDIKPAVIDEAIRRSLRFARENDSTVMRYVREHATEMQEDVMRKHIETYVNDYSEDIGEKGMAAVNELFARAVKERIIPPVDAVFA